jgi:predicted pyridoxine 5'-phosphate oxidase superfamily flavin-nucleotide-binding protein
VKLDESVRRVVREQSLGFVATVCPDGTANVSPKGTVEAWDDEHLVFLDLRSPGTVSNLASNPSMEINVVDPLRRKGYRFKGQARVLTEGDLFEEIVAFFRRERALPRERIRGAVLMRVEQLAPLTSPIYDLGASEEDVVAYWRARYLAQGSEHAVEAAPPGHEG